MLEISYNHKAIIEKIRMFLTDDLMRLHPTHSCRLELELVLLFCNDSPDVDILDGHFTGVCFLLHVGPHG